jgi:hypothetical protein
MPISTSLEFYDTFNYQIMKIKESGILHYIVKTYETTDGGISRNCENTRRQKGSPIDMYTIISPVILFIGGICASVLLLIIENCWKFGKKKQNLLMSCTAPVATVQMGIIPVKSVSIQFVHRLLLMLKSCRMYQHIINYGTKLISIKSAMKVRLQLK